MKFFDVTTMHPNDLPGTHRVEAAELHKLCSGHSAITRIQVTPWHEIFHRRLLDGVGFVEIYDVMGDDLEPLRSARQSTGNPTGADTTKDDSLRNRLWADKHVSPFESIILVVDMTVPLFVLRQLERHRTVNYCEVGMKEEIVAIDSNDEFRKWSPRNEFSARYATMPDQFWVPPARRIQKKGVANKQGSEGDFDPELQTRIVAEIEKLNEQARSLYTRMVNIGVTSEIARVVLPPSQMTKIRMQASLLNWFRFLALRLKPDVQEESRLYAEAIFDAAKLLFPRCCEAFLEHTFNAVDFSASEAEVVKLVFGAADHEARFGDSDPALDPLRDVDAKLKAKVFAKLGLVA